MGQFDHLNNVIPINLKFGMHSDIEGSGRNKITAGNLVVGIHDDTAASLYFATGNNGSYKTAIMPPPGVGMLCGLGFDSKPFYAMPVFNTTLSSTEATISFNGIPTHEEDNKLHYGTAFDVTSAVIEGATEIQAGLITAQNSQSFSGNKTFRGYAYSSNEVLYGPGTGDIARKSGITIYNNDFLPGIDTSKFVSGDLAPQINFEWLQHQSFTSLDKSLSFGTLMYDIEKTGDSNYQGIFKFLYPYAKRRMTVDANLRTNKISLTPEESVMHDSPSILPDNRNRSDYGSFSVYDGSAVLTLGGKNNSAQSTDFPYGDGKIKLFNNQGYSVTIFHDEKKYSRSGDLYLELPTHTGNGALATVRSTGAGIWPASGEVTGIIPFLSSDMQITSDYEGKPWVGSQLSWYRSLRMRWKQKAEDDTQYDLGSTIIEIGGQEWEEKAQYARNTKGEIYLHLGSYRDRSTHNLICDKIFKIKPPKDYKGNIHKNDVTLYLPDQVLANKLYYFDTDNGQLVSSNTYINNTKIAINSTSEPTENFYVNGNSKFNGNILPNLTTHTIGSSTARWNTLYVNTLMARNGNSVISEKDYETDCNTDCMIRIDSHINKGEDYNLNFSALPPYGNNANTLITVNRHSGKYITQLGLTSKGIFYRLGEAAVPTKDKEWNQLIYREVKTGSGFSAVGSTTLPVYVNTDGKVVACTADSVFSSLSWTAGNTSGPVLSITVAGKNRTSTIPSASDTTSGVVTTGAQTFAGDKTFNGNITLAGDNRDEWINFYHTKSSDTGYDWRIGYLGSGSGDANYFTIQTNSTTESTWTSVLRLGLTSYDATFAGNILPAVTKTKNLGSSSLYWNDLYTKTAHVGDGNTDSSSTTTGALIVNGGVGISKQLRVGGVATLSSSLTVTGTTTLKNTLYIKNANNGTEGSFSASSSTDTTAVSTILTLGNSTAVNTTGNRYGILRIYNQESKYMDIRPRSTGATTNSTFYLPQGSVASIYATWYSGSATGVGSASLPIYIDSTGKATACTKDSLFSAFSSSVNTLTITVAGQERTVAAVNSVSNTWANGTSAGPTITTTVNGVAGTAVAIPSASSSYSGVVTTGAQTFAGNKTFSGVTVISNNTDSTSTTTGALKVSGGVYVAKQLRVGSNLTVSGNTTLGDANTDTITVNGKTILKKDVTYGTTAPSETGTEGQIYFQIIS